MIFDDKVSSIIVEIAEKRNKDLLTTSKIVAGFYDTIKYIMENEPKGVIKADFLGKFTFNHAQKKKVDQMVKLKKEKDGSTRIG